MSRMCPTCGAREGEKQFINAFCIDCFAKQRRLIETPKEIAFIHCTKCGRIRVSGEWVSAHRNESKEEFQERVLKETILRKTRLAPGIEVVKASVEREKNFALFRAVLSLEGKRFETGARILVGEEKRSCEDCGKRAGGYYEAIIQLRGDPKRVERVALGLERTLNRKTFIAEVIVRKEGVDLQVGNKQAALQSLSQMGLTYSLSHKLIGMKEGKRVHRVTACVRI